MGGGGGGDCRGLFAATISDSQTQDIGLCFWNLLHYLKIQVCISQIRVKSLENTAIILQCAAECPLRLGNLTDFHTYSL